MTTNKNAVDLIFDLKKEGYNDIEGRLGYAICEAAADPFNGYQQIGKRVLNLLRQDDKYEMMIFAITGKTMEYLKKEIVKEADYFFL